MIRKRLEKSCTIIRRGATPHKGEIEETPRISSKRKIKLTKKKK